MLPTPTFSPSTSLMIITMADTGIPIISLAVSAYAFTILDFCS